MSGSDMETTGYYSAECFTSFSRNYRKRSSRMKPKEQVFFLLINEIPHDKNIARLNDIIQKDFAKLSMSGYLRDIVLPQKHSFSELPLF